MNFQELMQRMVELDQPVSEEKKDDKADKDYDGDGEIESGKDEYFGSRKKAAGIDEEIVDEEIVDECGMPGMDNMPSGMMGAPKQQDSVTMSVNMNGSGAGGIRDLMGILKNIEQAGDSGPEQFGDRDMDVIVKKEPGMDMMTLDNFGNEPDEMYKDASAVTGSGDDLHGNASRGAQGDRYDGMAPRGRPSMESLTTKLSSLYQGIKNR
jgi:hypothetical protein